MPPLNLPFIIEEFNLNLSSHEIKSLIRNLNFSFKDGQTILEFFCECEKKFNKKTIEKFTPKQIAKQKILFKYLFKKYSYAYLKYDSFYNKKSIKQNFENYEKNLIFKKELKKKKESFFNILENNQLLNDLLILKNTLVKYWIYNNNNKKKKKKFFLDLNQQKLKFLIQNSPFELQEINLAYIPKLKKKGNIKKEIIIL